jgi:hypothetical protein
LVGHAALPERLGRNQRFSSTGNLVTAALMGLIGYFLSYQAIFLTVAALALPLFVALARIRAADIHLVVSRLFRTFGLAERRPALAYAVMAPLIC